MQKKSSINASAYPRHRCGTNGRDWPDSWVTFGLLSCSESPTLAPYDPVATISNSISQNLAWKSIFSDSIAEKSSTCFRVGQQQGCVLYTPPPVLLSGASPPRKLVLGVTVGIRSIQWMCKFREIVNWHHMPLSFDKVRRNSYRQWITL